MRDSNDVIRVGVGTPQGNPVVEPEFRHLMPADVDYYVSRLTSTATDARERLVEYIEALPRYLAAYGPLQLSGFAFACTGSSYFVGAAREAELVAAANIGYPVITATAAIKSALERANARRLALLSPYPRWLTDASLAYWSDAGYLIDPVIELSVGSEDTAAIYSLADSAASRALAELDIAGIDAVLLTGTGMPTLAAVTRARAQLSLPVLSSNVCLAEALLEPFGLSPIIALPT